MARSYRDIKRSGLKDSSDPRNTKNSFSLFGRNKKYKDVKSDLKKVFAYDEHFLEAIIDKV